MTTEEKITTVQTLVGADEEATDAFVAVLLEKAKAAILTRRYVGDVPETVTDVPAKYEMLQCDLAARYFFRRGGEGEISHNENGISRSYKSVNDEDLLCEVTTVVKVG